MPIRRRHLLGCVLAAGLSACAVGPDYERPAVNPPDTFTTPAPAEVGDAAGPWWEGFGDPDLNALVERGLTENLDIQAARARLAEARALITSARSDFFPTVDGSAAASYTETRESGDATVERDAGGGLLLGWVPDLFGGTRRSVEAARAEAAAREALRDDAARVTVNTIVQLYVALRRDAALRSLVTQAVETRTRNADLVNNRVEAGLASTLDSARAAADVAATRAQLPALAQSIQAGRAALDVLVADWPRAVLDEEAAADAVPVFEAGPALALSQSALLRRPDVMAAEADLARATAEIGIATADLYPSLSVPGELSASLTDIGTSSAVTSFIGALAVQLDIPLFDAGGRRARVDAAEARAQDALFAYRAALLNAAADAETALAAIGNRRATRDALRDAVTASEAAYDRARGLYEQGLIDFFDVLDAQRTYLQTRQDLITAQAALAFAFADLYAAIGPAVVAD